MTLGEFIAVFRTLTGDIAQPYAFDDALVKMWLNEAQDEACERALLIHDWSTPAVCSISVTAGRSTYRAHESIINITRATFTPTGGSEALELDQTDALDLDRSRPHWRTESGEPQDFIHTDTKLRLGCLPETAGALALEVNRLALEPMAANSDEPEIAARLHRHLILWALHRAHNVPDFETLDLVRAEKAEREFIKMFGLRPDATIQRASESSLPHHNAAIWLG